LNSSNTHFILIHCGVFFGLQTVYHPFKEPAHNAAQAMLLFCAMVVAILNVVPADMSTNAMSTSHTMDDEVDALVVTEAALLFVPICAVGAWQAFVLRHGVRAGFVAATGAAGSIANRGLEAISSAYASCAVHCRGCSERSSRLLSHLLSHRRQQPLSNESDGSLRKSLLAGEVRDGDERPQLERPAAGEPAP
jgi:hypothetical protein